METTYSDAKHAILHVQNDRSGMGPIETINSDHNIAFVNAQNHRSGLGPIETCNSGTKVAVLNAKKNIGEVCDPWRLVILVLKSLFCMQKPQMRARTHRD